MKPNIKLKFNYNLLLKNAKNRPRDGWESQCWYIEQCIIQGFVDTNDTILHIGSHVFNPSNLYEGSYKPLFQKYNHKGEFIGVDVVPGKNVDVVCDFSNNFDALIDKFPNGVDLIICTSMLEHDKEPQKTIKNISSLLKIGGKVIFTAPCVQRAHGTAGVYGTYQNFLPDFFYYHTRKYKLNVIEGSFIFMPYASSEISRVDSVNRHEHMIYEKEEDFLSHDPDRINIPRIKSLIRNIKNYHFFKKWLLLIAGIILSKISNDFQLIFNNPIYWASNMALLCIKTE